MSPHLNAFVVGKCILPADCHTYCAQRTLLIITDITVILLHFKDNVKLRLLSL